MAEYNEAWYNNYIEGVVSTHNWNFKFGSFRATWWKFEYVVQNCMAEFSEGWYNSYIEGVVNDCCLTLKPCYNSNTTSVANAQGATLGSDPIWLPRCY